MGDHWKSLANKLGAPGVDAPVKETPSESPMPSAAPAANTTAKRSRSPEPERIKPTEAKPVAAKPVESKPVESKPVESKPPEPWGSQLTRELVPEAAVISRAPAQQAPAQQAPAQQASEPTRAASVQPAPVDPQVTAKPKRKSSWDALTSIFGIGSSQSNEPAQPTAPAARDAGRSDASVEAASSNTAKTTALDQLFGDAPRQELSWKKPAPARIIDDVSAWDAPVARDPVARDIASVEQSAIPISPYEATDLNATDPVEGDEADAPVRRRRRRRRGGRRDRDEATDGSTRDAAGRGASDIVGPSRPTRATGVPRRTESEPLRQSESGGDDWEEPEILDPVESSDEWSEPESFQGQTTDVDEDARPERRSSRRRRRGVRSRDKVDSTDPVATESVASAGEPIEPRVREPRTREPRVHESGEVRPERQPRELRTPREPRAPRSAESERPTRTRPPRTEPRRELAVVNSEDDEVDSSLAAELEEGSGPNRHPKIPTWTDSLEAIIAANMENHRRSDSRGGPPRGRPRGNGGGGGSRR